MPYVGWYRIEGNGTMIIQYILVAFAVGLAVLYLARGIWHSWRGGRCGSGCGSGCASKPSTGDGLVKPEDLLVRVKERRGGG